MGYQESFVYSKSGNNQNIDLAIDIIKKYGYEQYDVVSIAKVEVLRDFSNGHKQRWPILNWPVGTQLLMTFGERYWQRSINRLFMVDIAKKYNNPNLKDDDEDFLIDYTDDEYKILDDLEIVFIDDFIDPKLKGPFESYFGNPEFIRI